MRLSPARIRVPVEPVQASALRLVVADSNDHTYSRVLELEAYPS